MKMPSGYITNRISHLHARSVGWYRISDANALLKPLSIFTNSSHFREADAIVIVEYNSTQNQLIASTWFCRKSLSRNCYVLEGACAPAGFGINLKASAMNHRSIIDNAKVYHPFYNPISPIIYFMAHDMSELHKSVSW